ncbi:hypothetical protein [Novosphingobium pentaromativorans]|uniref:Uncharacterized protein n=1 Tax=Novosphingobium pentaromativorans US6-1 TaxID=1088721 RepID=G6EGT3_9SPHN|nr:hypothetical protein [Novosphingobium pentaromativorans]AIT82070.1 hypothetical protein JI59_21250 [Novosphingobium pentaromativorans US6-1]EHJ59526.1 hypothetical protein NSU_3554 [Novosphingobium pentaromativorans US6-1]
MHAFDRRLLYSWLLLTLGAGCALFMPVVIVLLMLTIIGIPLGWLIALMPGAWLYLTPTLAIYAILRRLSDRTPHLAMLAVAAILPLAAGFGIPWWANGITERRVQLLIAQDHGTPPILQPNLSITHAIDRGLGSPGKCSDTCQRLLFSRTAKSITQVPLDKLSNGPELPSPAHRFSLGSIGPECNRARLQMVYASSAETGRDVPPPPPPLWDKLDEFRREGLCLHDEMVRDVRTDILVVERWNYDPAFRGFHFDGGGWRLSLHPITPFKRREVFRRTPAGLVRLMRRTEVRYALLAEPLWLSPGFSFDTTTPTHWVWRDGRVAGSPLETFEPTQWNGIIANDLTVSGLR